MIDSGCYILDANGQPKHEPDVRKWAAWYESAAADKSRIVKVTKIGEVIVSTVFLGLNHNFGEGPPLLFETMAFGDSELDGQCSRYATRAEAVEGHDEWVACVREDQP